MIEFYSCCCSPCPLKYTFMFRGENGFVIETERNKITKNRTKSWSLI